MYDLLAQDNVDNTKFAILRKRVKYSGGMVLRSKTDCSDRMSIWIGIDLCIDFTKSKVELG